MSKFWELFRESVIVQAIVTLGLIGTLCYMWISEVDVPGELYTITGIVMGFWFKSKGVAAESKNLATIERIVSLKKE